MMPIFMKRKFFLNKGIVGAHQVHILEQNLIKALKLNLEEVKEQEL